MTGVMRLESTIAGHGRDWFRPCITRAWSAPVALLGFHYRALRTNGVVGMDTLGLKNLSKLAQSLKQ